MRTVAHPAPGQLAREMPLALGLCWQLVDIPTRAEYLVAASTAIARAFDADVVFWYECVIRDQTWSVVDVECSQESRANVARCLTDAGRDHPAVASYLLDPQDLSPRRASDAIARAGHPYPGPIGSHQLLGMDHQMSILVALTPDSGRCWVLLRQGHDFTPEQLAAAGDVQALLTALDRLHPSPHYTAPRSPVLTPLTEREAEVLRQVATGATAIAVGRRLGISPGTVRKHLERVYAKLDCHDRLIAVEKGRELGLIPALGHPRGGSSTTDVQGLGARGNCELVPAVRR